MREKHPMKDMEIGFTGTQDGATEIQLEFFTYLVRDGRFKTFYHGDCIGADAQAHRIVQKESPDTEIEICPPTESRKRAFCMGVNKIHSTQPYLVRNKEIVARGKDLLIALVKGREVMKSGTWSTVRHSRKLGTPRIIIYPTGQYFYEQD